MGRAEGEGRLRLGCWQVLRRLVCGSRGLELGVGKGVTGRHEAGHDGGGDGAGFPAASA